MPRFRLHWTYRPRDPKVKTDPMLGKHLLRDCTIEMVEEFDSEEEATASLNALINHHGHGLFLKYKYIFVLKNCHSTKIK